MKLLVFILFFLPLILFAGSKTDSLENISRTGHDSMKVKSLVVLADMFKRKDPVKAFDYAMQCVSVAEKNGSDLLLGKAYLTAGMACRYRNEMGKAIEYYKKTLTHFEKAGFEKGIGEYHNQIGLSKYYIGSYAEAMEHFLSSMAIAERRKDQGDIAMLSHNIAMIYFDRKKYQDAISYYNRALKYFIQKNKKVSIGVCESNIGAIYDMLEKYDTARIHYNKALEAHRSVNDKRGIAADLLNLANTELFLENYKVCEKYIREAVQLNKELDDIQGLSICDFTLANLSMRTNKIDEAITLLHRSEQRADSAGYYKLKSDIYEKLAECYTKLNDFELAYNYQLKFNAVKDSLFNEASNQQMADMQTRYETEKIEKSLSEANRQKEIQKVKHDNEMKQGRVVTYSSVAGLILVAFLTLVIFNRYQIKRKANMLLESRNREIEKHKNIILEKNKDITDSIRYARRIQEAILPGSEKLKSLQDHFIFYAPKDIVSGDFYFVHPDNDSVLFASVDCTGHGVPGAFMSIVAHNILQHAVLTQPLHRPDKILNFLDKSLHDLLIAEGKENIRDGMDISLCHLDRENLKLSFAGAYNPLWLVRNNTLSEVAADKIPVGSGESVKTAFSYNEIDVFKGDMLYVFSDGYADQFGGSKGKKFKTTQLKQVLASVSELNSNEQKQKVEQIFNDWKKDYEQVDDVLIIGVRV